MYMPSNYCLAKQLSLLQTTVTSIVKRKRIVQRRLPAKLNDDCCVDESRDEACAPKDRFVKARKKGTFERRTKQIPKVRRIDSIKAVRRIACK